MPLRDLLLVFTVLMGCHEAPPPVTRPPPAPTAPTPAPAPVAAADAGPDCGQCPDGTTCQLVQVQCIRAPCPPLPQCVAPRPAPPRCEPACATGETCVSEQVECKRAPCPPVLHCQPAR